MKIAGSDGTSEPRMFIPYYSIRSTSSRRSRREVSTHSQYTLTWSNTPLLTPCFAFLASAFLAKLANYSNLHSSLAIHVIQFTNCFLFRHKNPYTETTHLPCLNFAIYAVHMQSYMLPSHSMGSWWYVSLKLTCLLKPLQLLHHISASDEALEDKHSSKTQNKAVEDLEENYIAFWRCVYKPSTPCKKPSKSHKKRSLLFSWPKPSDFCRKPTL